MQQRHKMTHHKKEPLSYFGHFMKRMSQTLQTIGSSMERSASAMHPDEEEQVLDESAHHFEHQHTTLSYHGVSHEEL